MKQIATLKAINSKADIHGNRYWALQYFDHETGKVIQGKVSGGESNIYAILNGWQGADSWNRSVRFETDELPIRQFDRLTKGWDYAGCTPDDLGAFIQKGLAA